MKEEQSIWDTCEPIEPVVARLVEESLATPITSLVPLVTVER